MNMNRPSKMFSVMNEVPSLTAASPTAIGSRSVANPGYGSVDTSTAAGRRSMVTRNAPGSVITSAPALTSLSSAISRCPGSTPRTVT